jgi:hypothetical protein
MPPPGEPWRSRGTGQPPGAAGDDLYACNLSLGDLGHQLQNAGLTHVARLDLVAEPGQQDDRCVASRACGARR